MTSRPRYRAVASIWTALIRGKAERSFLDAEACSLLDVDDVAGNAGLAIAECELAGDALS
jgi:hypothetical protein